MRYEDVSTGADTARDGDAMPHWEFFMLPQNFARAAKLRLRDLFATTAWAGLGNIETSWINIGLGGGEWLQRAAGTKRRKFRTHWHVTPLKAPTLFSGSKSAFIIHVTPKTVVKMRGGNYLEFPNFGRFPILAPPCLLCFSCRSPRKFWRVSILFRPFRAMGPLIH